MFADVDFKQTINRGFQFVDLIPSDFKDVGEHLETVELRKRENGDLWLLSILANFRGIPIHSVCIGDLSSSDADPRAVLVRTATDVYGFMYHGSTHFRQLVPADFTISTFASILKRRRFADIPQCLESPAGNVIFRRTSQKALVTSRCDELEFEMIECDVLPAI